MKEKHLENLAGTQIGMIAPNPEFKTITGKQSNIKDLSEKPILIVNIAGCTPRTYVEYKNIVQVTVLKDKNSMALYGENARNGEHYIYPNCN
ncbi:MAG TPA: hypothetical protein VK179_21250 [Bacteroidales bacterium]|nr:hypothetical protein [Bacteroidales bacterium]